VGRGASLAPQGRQHVAGAVRPRNEMRNDRQSPEGATLT
jgi:hypothetical protein